MAGIRPQKIGKYNVISELGRGATSVVYLGEDEFNDRKVAIKVANAMEGMSPEEAKRFEKLFLNEASLVGKLSHPNIVAVHDAVVDGDVRYIVMECVNGGNLKKFCTETNLLPVRQAVLAANEYFPHRPFALRCCLSHIMRPVLKVQHPACQHGPSMPHETMHPHPTLYCVRPSAPHCTDLCL